MGKHNSTHYSVILTLRGLKEKTEAGCQRKISQNTAVGCALLIMYLISSISRPWGRVQDSSPALSSPSPLLYTSVSTFPPLRRTSRRPHFNTTTSIKPHLHPRSLPEVEGLGFQSRDPTGGTIQPRTMLWRCFCLWAAEGEDHTSQQLHPTVL